MLKGDGAAVDAMENEYQATQNIINGLKIGLGVTMGANIHGKAGNQLTQQNDGRAPQVGKPQFAKNDTPMHVTELSDKEDKGVTNFGGGNADFFRDQRNGDTIPTTEPDLSDPTSDFWRTHEMPDPFDPNDPNLKNAPLRPGMKEPDYTKEKVYDIYGNGKTDSKQGVTNSGGGNADFFKDQREEKSSKNIQGEHLPEKDTLDMFKKVGTISDAVGNAPYKKVLKDIAQMKDLTKIDDAKCKHNIVILLDYVNK